VSILGNRVLRREDPKFLTTGGVYGDDLDGDGALWATFVRSTMAHARIVALEVAEALERPGVRAVFTGPDVDLAPMAAAMPGIHEAMTRSVLARDVVRYVGEPVAVVITDTRYQGEDAVEAVFVDYDPLPVVVDPEAALAGETLLFPEAGTNIAIDFRAPLDEHLFDGCEVVVRQRVLNQRVAPCPMEVRSGLASWGEDGRLTQWMSVQAPHAARDELIATFGLEPGQVRVIAPDVGGGFGAKVPVPAEDIVAAWAAKRLGHPVRWTETRSESMLNLVHGRGQIQDLTIGGTRDGRVEAYRIEIIQDAGAYPSIGAFLPMLTKLMAPGTYDIAKVEGNPVAVATNTTPTGAYRGAGRPEATAAIERAMDLFAAEIGMDPAEVRRRNLVAKFDEPHATPTGFVYDSGDYPRALDLVLSAAGYDDLRKDQARRREEGGPRQLGIGVSTYVEITNGLPDPGELAVVEVLPTGKARVFTGTSPHGQGHLTAWSMLASDELGIPIDDIEVIANDTDLIPEGGGTMGSRSLQAGGLAVYEASTILVGQAKELAADLLEANPDDVVLDKAAGVFHVAGTPAVSRSWADVAGSASDGAGLRVERKSEPPGPTFPFGAHVAVVEVDTETGEVRLERLVAVDDAGIIMNPLLAEGQRHGGFAQGAAQALYEEVRYDEDGNPVTANLADYAMISAAELPSFELVAMETPTPVNRLGVKGIGEAGTIGATPAVQSAVVDAVAHLGVRHIDMPATPERVWKVLAQVQGTTTGTTRTTGEKP
jgi:carbon-monoxide dehydrogenase large subunit